MRTFQPPLRQLLRHHVKLQKHAGQHVDANHSTHSYLRPLPSVESMTMKTTRIWKTRKIAAYLEVSRVCFEPTSTLTSLKTSEKSH